MQWSPIILLVALFSAWWLTRSRQQKLHLADEDRAAINIAAICGAIIGARLPFWLENGFTSGNWVWWADGKTILGGFLGAYLTVEIVKEARGVKVLTGDSFAVPTAVMLAIGRLACFCSGCCYGRPTTLPWGINFSLPGEMDSTPRHPTQLYEILFHTIAAGCLLVLERYDLLKGQRLKAYLLAYAVFRFVTEWLRPEPVFAVSMTAYQWAALLLMIPLLIQWRLHARRLKQQPTLALEESLPPNNT